MIKYACSFSGRRVEVQAASESEARRLALAALKLPVSKRNFINIVRIG